VSAVLSVVEAFAGRHDLGIHLVVHPVPSPSSAPAGPVVGFPHVTPARVLLVVVVCLVAYWIGGVREAWLSRRAQRVANVLAERKARADRRAERLLDAEELRWRGVGGAPRLSWWSMLLGWLFGPRRGGRW
jgi:hypothetical protein